MDEVRVRELDGRVLDTHALCALVSERHSALVDLECELLELAAVWADHYSALPDVEDVGPVLPGAEKLKAFGGDGTPWVWEFAPAEFGVLQQMSMYQASNVIRNALDLRHRLPLIWARVRAGQVRAWRACKVADATHGLSHAAAGFVDRAMVEALTQLPWGRCQKRLQAKIIEADPERAEQLAKERAAERFVRTGRSEDGFTTIFARATAGDVVWLDATLDRIAAILALRGDTDSKDVRRSKALGIIAQPARAMLLLAEYDDTLFADDDADTVPAGTDPAESRPAESCPTDSWPADEDESGSEGEDESRSEGEDESRSEGGDESRSEGGDESRSEGGDESRSGNEDEPCGEGQPSETGNATESGVRAEHGEQQGRQADLDATPSEPWDQDDTDLSDGDLTPEQREGSEADAATIRNTALIRERLQTLKPADLLPPVTLHLHLHADTLAGLPGAVRFEGVGPITMGQLKDLFGTGCHVKVQPVIDLNDVPSSDAYEAPERLKDALLLRSPADVFPFATRTRRGMDFDHTINYRPPERGGPPGQTRIGNGGLLSRRSHRMKTHGRWQLRQPEPGSYLWRSPHGWVYLINATGTHELGGDVFARLAWAAAKDAPILDVVRPFDHIELQSARQAG